MSIDTDLLEEILIYTLNNDLLANIFKDLIWGIIRYKENNWEDSSERFRGFIEHSHRALYEELIDLTSNPFHLDDHEKAAKNYYNKLRYYIFWNLSINQTQLLDENREDYKSLATKFHEIISYANKSNFLSIIINCIKLLLLTGEIMDFLENNHADKLKAINITNKYNKYLSLQTEDIIETFIHISFSKRKIRDLIFQKSILDSDDISNSKVLQKYLPHYVFSQWRIEKILNEGKPLPFRVVGPHIADFEIGDWIYIPKIAKYIFKLLNKNKKSTLISAISGTGKTVISRWIGYKFYKMGYKVFYIDCLDHKPKNIETVLDQIIIQHKSAKKFQDTLFIFDNIHVLDKELRLKLNECKEITLILLTERVFDGERKEMDNFSQNFEGFQNVEIVMDHWSYRNTVKGIIKLNAKNTLILNQIKYIGNQNLWIYAIILKLFKASLEIKKDSSIIDIFTDFDLVGGLITEYFDDLLKTKAIKLKSSEFDVYSNHLHYLLGILSIYSEYELWTNRGFIEHIISIEDITPLGTLNSKININKEILTEVQSFLINIFEVSSRIVFVKPGIKELELKIPHSQMAIIYKNCVLKKYERGFPGLIEQLQFLYISFGKYFGSFLQQKYLNLMGYINFDLIKTRFFDFGSYLKDLNYLKNPQILQEQILNNSIEEIERFFYYFSIYNNSLEEKLVKNIFQEEPVLFNHSWKFKIEESNSSYLYLLLRRIKKYLGITAFIDFIEMFQIEIFNILKQDRGDYIFSFLNFFLDLNFDLWAELDKNISDLIDQTSLNMDDLFSVYARNRKFFENISKAHRFYPLVKHVLKKLILNINFEEEQKFVPSPYYNYGEVISQIYQEIIDELLTQSNQKLYEAYEGKLRNSNLIIIINYLKDFYEHNSSTAMRFFKKFVNIIKEKLYESDVDNIETFFDILTMSFKEEKEFIKSTLLSNWECFIGIFLKLSNSEFFYFSKLRIVYGFFEDLFPELLDRYSIFFIQESKKRIQEYYESLEFKLDIVNKLNNFLGDEINEFILNLFNKSIYDSLEIQSISFYIKTFSKLNLSYSLKAKWDFKEFILSDNFKKKLMNAKDSELKEFFNIFWKGDAWGEILFEVYNDFLIERFGENFSNILKVSKEQIQYLDNLKNHIRKLEIAEIIKTYNYYSDPLFSHKKAYEFVEFRKFLDETRDNLLSDELEKKLNLLEFTEILNFLTILKIYHPNIVKDFCEKYHDIIYQKSRGRSSEIIEILTILEFYKLDIGFLKELDGYTNEELSLFQMILECLRKIDLCTLRYLFQINPANFLKYYTNINISNHLKHSTLLQLSIFLYKEELKVAQKNPGYTYLRKMSFMGGPIQKYPFILELLEKDFINIKDRFEPILILDFYYRNYKKDRITFLRHNDLLIKLISNQFIPFRNKITELIQKSEICFIALYLKSLTKNIGDLEKNKLKIPETLEKYLISEEFNNKIKKAEFYDIYRLFKYLKMINFSLSREIWIRNRKIFEDEAFAYKVRKDYAYWIFKFYDMFNDTHFNFNLESIKILKKIMRLKPLEIIIPYFLEIQSNEEFNTLFSIFKEELINIAKKYSKFELKRMLSERFMRKYNQDSLAIINTIFKERLDEKYFFES